MNWRNVQGDESDFPSPRVFATPGELPVTVSEADAVLAAHLSAVLHTRLDWKQADACAADIVNMFSRKGWRVMRSA